MNRPATSQPGGKSNDNSGFYGGNNNAQFSQTASPGFGFNPAGGALSKKSNSFFEDDEQGGINTSDAGLGHFGTSQNIVGPAGITDSVIPSSRIGQSLSQRKRQQQQQQQPNIGGTGASNQIQSDNQSVADDPWDFSKQMNNLNNNQNNAGNNNINNNNILASFSGSAQNPNIKLFQEIR